MNLYQQQASNRRRTWLIMAVFVAFLFLLGYGFDLFYIGTTTPVAGSVALVYGTVSSVVSYIRGDRAVLASAGAIPLDDAILAAPDADRLKLRQYDNVVDEMAIAAGLPRPKASVIPDPDPNAFATGRGPSRATIAVTQGLLDSVSREELQGVVAHEMSHIRNEDMRVMTMVASLVGALALLSDWAGRALRFGARSNSGKGDGKKGGGAGPVAFAIWALAVILAPVVAQLLAMLVSRRREYLADATAAELTRNPLALASALEKIEAADAPTSSIKRGTANLCIADPLQRPVGLREGRIADLLASHPPMPKRIEALREMAYAAPGRTDS